MGETLLKKLRSSWIWPAELGNSPNQYIQFRHEFAVEKVNGGATLLISTDTAYAVRLNGQFIDAGFFSDYPDNKSCDRLDIDSHVVKGRNLLSILVHYCGQSSSSYIKGLPGIAYVLTVGNEDIASGTDTFYRVSPCYRQGPMGRTSPQLGFAFEYNAMGEDGWKSPEYAYSEKWIRAHDKDIATLENIPRLREIKKCQIGSRTAAHVLDQGFFNSPDGAEYGSVAEQMQATILSARSVPLVFNGHGAGPLELSQGININTGADQADGVYLIVDLHREEVGFLELALDAHADTQIDIAYGEHLGDQRVRAAIGGRNFAGRYICKEGPQCFTHYFARWAGRYLQLHVGKSCPPLRLDYAGLRSVTYPVKVLGEFDSPEALQKNIYDTSVRTLHLCMHEHYEDCPWREQSMYANDTRIQALCGYYCFGEYDFAKNSLSLLGDGLKDDGYLELCAPGEVPITIPAFSLMWILALADHLLFSGDVEFSRSRFGQVQQMLDTYLTSMTDRLMPSPQGERFWHFYDWAEGLDGVEEGDSRKFSNLRQLRYDGPLNLLLSMSITAAITLAQASDQSGKLIQRYQRIRTALHRHFHSRFWDDKAQAYRTYIGENCQEHFAELTQSLAICAKACPEDTADKLRHKLAAEDNGLVSTTLSQSLYKFEALASDKDRFGQWVLDRIAFDWGSMLNSGATSFWETINGASDFDGAGSLCHGWSAIPVYFYQAYLLGVRPLEPGFRRFAVDPLRNTTGDVSGQIPTPYGLINVRWAGQDEEARLNLSSPEGTEPVLP